jgi:hypothetical protein
MDEQTEESVYYRYYLNQAGYGYAHPNIATFKGPIYQRGNGLGSVFSSLWKSITPLFKSTTFQKALKSAGNQALRTGYNVGSDLLEGKNFGQSVKQRALESGEAFLNELTGSGRKRGRKRKRATKAKAAAPKAKRRKTSRKPKKKKAAKKAKPKKRKSKSKPRKKKTKSIFD